VRAREDQPRPAFSELSSHERSCLIATIASTRQLGTALLGFGLASSALRLACFAGSWPLAAQRLG